MESSNNGDKGKVVISFKWRAVIMEIKGKVVPLIARTPRIHARYLLQGHLGSMQGTYYKAT